MHDGDHRHRGEGDEGKYQGIAEIEGRRRDHHRSHEHQREGIGDAAGQVKQDRELQHIEEGRRIINGILEKLADLAKVEKAPTMEGKRMTAMLAPK